jgi:hypothetical protein
MTIASAPLPWHVQSNPSEVTPIEDLRDHQSGVACWCRPFMEDDVIVHNALDGREKWERKIAYYNDRDALLARGITITDAGGPVFDGPDKNIGPPHWGKTTQGE